MIDLGFVHHQPVSCSDGEVEAQSGTRRSEEATRRRSPAAGRPPAFAAPTLVRDRRLVGRGRVSSRSSPSALPGSWFRASCSSVSGPCTCAWRWSRPPGGATADRIRVRRQSEDEQHLLVGSERPRSSATSVSSVSAAYVYRAHRRQQFAARMSGFIFGRSGTVVLYGRLEHCDTGPQCRDRLRDRLERRQVGFDAGGLQGRDVRRDPRSGIGVAAGRICVVAIFRVSWASTPILSAYCSKRDVVAAVHLPDG